MIGAILDRLRDARRRRIWNPDLASGRRGEDLAHRFLRRRGYTIVARNYRLAAGEAEADIIAWEAGELVFIEVKSRSSEDYGPPERAIGPEKRAHLRCVAREYARKANIPQDKIRFDVVTVVFAQPPRIELIRSAFSRI